MLSLHHHHRNKQKQHLPIQNLLLSPPPPPKFPASTCLLWTDWSTHDSYARGLRFNPLPKTHNVANGSS